MSDSCKIAGKALSFSLDGNVLLADNLGFGTGIRLEINPDTAEAKAVYVKNWMTWNDMLAGPSVSISPKDAADYAACARKIGDTAVGRAVHTLAAALTPPQKK